MISPTWWRRASHNRERFSLSCSDTQAALMWPARVCKNKFNIWIKNIQNDHALSDYLFINIRWQWALIDDLPVLTEVVSKAIPTMPSSAFHSCSKATVASAMAPPVSPCPRSLGRKGAPSSLEPHGPQTRMMMNEWCDSVGNIGLPFLSSINFQLFL